MAAARLKIDYDTNIKKRMMDRFKYTSVMQVPRIEKIVLNVGMGDGHSNQNALNAAIEELSRITGQHAVKTVAKKSIANFKIREGYDVGCRVTLRGAIMFEFLDRLINIALPRVRDFKGLSTRSFDNFGNYNFSVREQIIFPEIDFDKVDKIHGINITIVTNSKSKDETKALLDEFKMPFREQG
ncbi:MAG TPA: 50S ribosomal protein L5 [Spirochaetota bacterium]|jgi:large subunit ribosomal protein L5|nr:50S ribosomal protein L5 [Spirochaetota bacterium]OPZ38059.1 MAG: 50S ribosomal protein L5 [Spirochaetes bacterium ADurb.BinA120]HNU91906.1 50S ribosomal protein L5 [Spirochaetota bacterium]HPV97656.1 50S ribosomal protein L5 [Spirochaetota bacterium]